MDVSPGHPKVFAFTHILVALITAAAVIFAAFIAKADFSRSDPTLRSSGVGTADRDSLRQALSAEQARGARLRFAVDSLREALVIAHQSPPASSGLDTQTARVIAALRSTIQVEQARSTRLQTIVDSLLQPSGVPSRLTPSSPAPGATAPTALEITQEDFVFRLVGCSRPRRDEVACDLLITNERPDRELVLYTSVGGSGGRAARFFSDSGDEYLALEVSLASLTALASSRQWAVQATLPRGVATKARVRFADIPPDVKRIQMLQISFWSGDLFKAQFRNLIVR